MTITGAVIDGNRAAMSGGGIRSDGAIVSISGSLLKKS
jgi:predicted outer membrane repeat protein